ncbi:MAG: methylenetetrahydrofolate--tRNA-(uracil(54)-C(5))-methyltransferase (FADH(2)-oxidizing) TrmFO [Nitrospirae bacterium]|nr:methylenetetrahydrofolate--tRNA-(uracil(54)-C(5))-methyltransferase (FADH(2)-oxidizing) TrmFO [Nitrospirota bacterium]MBI3353003.1 methylenetetrahydrofolate--tRNA-(uracil(54)-C(5))-methyltransferase (FADH(2)-oxidizing) TrmFO [Nitrospirota bacterium]
MSDQTLTVIGGGLAGSEAAWQAAEQGVKVRLFEGRPSLTNGAHVTGDLAEIVCSNSLGSNDPFSAPGLLKNELRLLRSLIIQTADRFSVPAGSALAVDRELFSKQITHTLEAHPNITVFREEIKEIPADRPVIIATGPLTSSPLAESLSRLTQSERLYFFDAISPILEADSIDRSIVFKASRYDDGEGDYLNCPMTESEYQVFYEALMAGDKVIPKSFEAIPYFEGCMPIEVLAERGIQTPLFGPMKPVGLLDPRTGKRPYAVVQLRQENQFASCYNMVGFQTKLRYGEQKRIFRLIPGMENAEFLRFGSLHRNTFIHAPSLLTPALQLHQDAGVFIAGQLTGVEGYVEASAMGLLAGLNAARASRGEPLLVPPLFTAHGALIHYLTSGDSKHFQPMNINFGLFPPLATSVKQKDIRKKMIVNRALEELKNWIQNFSILETT